MPAIKSLGSPGTMFLLNVALGPEPVLGRPRTVTLSRKDRPGADLWVQASVDYHADGSIRERKTFWPDGTLEQREIFEFGTIRSFDSDGRFTGSRQSRRLADSEVHETLDASGNVIERTVVHLDSEGRPAEAIITGPEEQPIVQMSIRHDPNGDIEAEVGQRGFRFHILRRASGEVNVSARQPEGGEIVAINGILQRETIDSRDDAGNWTSKTTFIRDPLTGAETMTGSLYRVITYF